jgi:polyisoprenoid-binding protein YceI
MKLLSLFGAAVLLSPVGLMIASPSSASEPLPAPAPAPAAGSYVVDGTHSSMVFKIKHVGAAWFYGRFNKIEGSFAVEDGGGSKIEVRIDPASVDTANTNRDDHLKGPDFFNVKEFPELTFTSSKITKNGDQYEVVGDLTMHGVTKQVTAKAEHTGTGEMRGTKKSGFHAVLTVKRSEFGMEYGLPDALGDEVEIAISLEGSAK